MKASVKANSNIALVKYWGKRDKRLMLPQNGSISMTVDGMSTHTTIEFDGKYQEDSVSVNNEEVREDQGRKDIIAFLDLIRERAGITEKARANSVSNFPVAAGLASSASGLAALAMAAAKASGLELGTRELSMLARRGSGSASRSVEGGFVEWHRGQAEDGTDSFAEQVAPPEHWPEFRMVIAVTSKKEKKVKSRAGMAQTVETCPYYPEWLETINEDLDAVREGIKEKDFTAVGRTAEHNCLKMHATMMTTKPAIIYWNPATMRIIHSVMEWRDSGLECYFTIDAGPQVKVMCLEKDAEEIAGRLKGLEGVEDIIMAKPGKAAEVVDNHLF
jgi:diphosphomevalonate decarboxylase